MIAVDVKCAHCGDKCDANLIKSDELRFCCNGCAQVYKLLHDHNLGQYYRIEANPGIKTDSKSNENLDYLEDEEVVSKIIDFRDTTQSKVHFHCPPIHCSSCIWLLEKLHLINPAILNTTVNFLEKKIYISYDHSKLSLKELVILLNKIGYHPELNFANLDAKSQSEPDRKLLLKIGVAGFAFGNIMLLSFIEYLGYEMAASKFYIGYINLALALPVIFYSGSDYFNSAWQSLKMKRAGIDIPVVLGMLALFLRSVYEILSQTGGGYLDSLAGFVLFLLIGRWFSNYTLRSINFERNYKSYFPISVQIKKGEGLWTTSSIEKIMEGDIIKIRNGEIIPCDGTLLHGKAKIDYSFVSGEAKLNLVDIGENIFAGGKQEAGAIEVLVSKSVDQSYLTQLWNEKAFSKSRSNRSSQFLDSVSASFTYVILLIAGASFGYWYFSSPSLAFKVVSSVLIVACPCALALSIPFILGNASRILGKIEFYAKSVQTLEDLFDIDTIVFDKTGTLTESDSMEAHFSIPHLPPIYKSYIRSTTSQSKHPLSEAISRHLTDANIQTVHNFTETKGYGIEATVDSHKVKIGSAAFIFGQNDTTSEQHVLVEIDEKVIGHFDFVHNLRPGLKETIANLGNYQLAVLSGDNDNEKERMREIFPSDAKLHFNRDPKEKLKIIQELQRSGRNVMMVGDGLNDAGALKQSNVGLVITENNNSFSPACDAILASNRFSQFISYLSYIKSLRTALYVSFVIALMYNLIGLFFAVTGQLSPIIAAILMPTSSISIMIFGVLSSRLLAYKYLGKSRFNKIEV